MQGGLQDEVVQGMLEAAKAQVATGNPAAALQVVERQVGLDLEENLPA